MPWYPKAVRKNIPPGANDPSIKGNQRIAVLHVAATMADSLYDYFNGPSGGVEAHFYAQLDGGVEQYRDTDWQADANLDANDFSISIESQGLGDGIWTDAQIATIQQLLLWIHDQHPKVVLKVCDAWDGKGVGYHTMWGAPSHWTPVVKTCPGPNRITQFHKIITPWLNAGAPPPEDDMQFSDKIPGTDITVRQALLAAANSAQADALSAFRTNELARDQAEKQQLDAILTAIKAIPTGPGGTLTVDDVTAACEQATRNVLGSLNDGSKK